MKKEPKPNLFTGSVGYHLCDRKKKFFRIFCEYMNPRYYIFYVSKDIPVNKLTGHLKKPLTLIEIADDGNIPF